MDAIHIPTSQNKEAIYKALLPQIKAVVSTEQNNIANMANVAAILKTAFSGFFWVGFYRNINNELVLGPFQGPIACTRIAFGKGVCGTAAAQQKTIIVPNVHKFPGHIACSALSNSEIVVPLVKNNTTQYILDIDSTNFNFFNTIDAHYLEQVIALIP